MIGDGDTVMTIARRAVRYVSCAPECAEQEDMIQDVAMALWRASLRRRIDHPWTYAVAVARNIRARAIRRELARRSISAGDVRALRRSRADVGYDPLLMSHLARTAPDAARTVMRLMRGHLITDLLPRRADEATHAYECRLWRWRAGLLSAVAAVRRASRQPASPAGPAAERPCDGLGAHAVSRPSGGTSPIPSLPLCACGFRKKPVKMQRAKVTGFSGARAGADSEFLPPLR